MDWPVVDVGNKESPSYLPVEVCKVAPGQHYRGVLDAHQTKQIQDFAVRALQLNAKSICELGFQTIGLHEEAFSSLVGPFFAELHHNLMSAD